MASNGWKMRDASPEALELWANTYPPDVEFPTQYVHPSGLLALVGREPYDRAGDDVRWHISVRYGDPGVNGRIPTWDELVSAAHDLRPGVVFVVGIPPKSWWMSVHPHVLHLEEVRDPALVQRFRDNAMGHPVT